MTDQEVAEIVERHAARAIGIAREVPLTGTADPKDLRRLYWPETYEDSPELPARRLASQWDTLYDDPPTDEDGFEIPEAIQPPLLAAFGGDEARAVWDAGRWDNYEMPLRATLKESDVQAFQTSYDLYRGGVLEELVAIVASIYVVDLRRYDWLEPILTTWDGIEGQVANEKHLLDELIPTSLSRVQRGLRRREWKRKVKEMGIRDQ